MRGGDNQWVEVQTSKTDVHPEPILLSGTDTAEGGTRR